MRTCKATAKNELLTNIISKGGSNMELDLTSIGAGLAIGLSAIATAYAQAKIGSAAIGAIAEKRELTGIMILFIAIPETMVILGFVIGILLIYGK